MRKNFIDVILENLMIFIYYYPFFSFFVFISAVLLFVMAALSFGSISLKWERRCALALFFSIIPVCVWGVFFLKPVFSPDLTTYSIWIFMTGIFSVKWLRSFFYRKNPRPDMKMWKCVDCKALNEEVFLVCKECNLPRPSQK